jgi:hypothetical protein
MATLITVYKLYIYLYVYCAFPYYRLSVMFSAVFSALNRGSGNKEEI